MRNYKIFYFLILIIGNENAENMATELEEEDMSNISLGTEKAITQHFNEIIDQISDEEAIAVIGTFEKSLLPKLL